MATFVRVEFFAFAIPRTERHHIESSLHTLDGSRTRSRRKSAPRSQRWLGRPHRRFKEARRLKLGCRPHVSEPRATDLDQRS
ncbi:hypothetical protein WS67_15630 [Burkholderia singularis]|uniref:Uncharacterized protein n=1 Tax=Burkholderia singularis TaxID=1503053 RepID=A0A118DNT6_9BURK|nr:hypothetical protein WS67_15630 [Burkholderia singularis]